MGPRTRRLAIKAYGYDAAASFIGSQLARLSITKLLLNRLKDAPEVFAGLFRRVSPDALVRF